MMNAMASATGLLSRALVMGAIVCVAAGAVRAQAAAETTAYRARPVAKPGVLRGHVVFNGTVPRPVPLRIVSDYDCCDRTPKFTENYQVGPEGGLGNCVVRFLDVAEGKPMPKTTPTVDQVECVFVPHVVLGQFGGNVRFLNSDTVFHNVHGYLIRGWFSLFNFGMPNKGYVVEKPVTAPGPIILKCDAGHKWMTSYIYSVDNPYAALTRKDGRFVIDGVPPGAHRVQVWHETLGELDLKLDIPPSATVEIKIDGRLDRKPRLATVAGPTVVPSPTASAWLYPPTPGSVAFAAPSPVASSAPASPGAGLDPTAPPPGSPGDTEDEGVDRMKTIWLVTGGLAVVLVFLLVIWWTREPVAP